MTRKELVDLLVANYAEDDEVYVRSWDDHQECVDKVKGIEDVTQTHCNGHYEVRKDKDSEWETVKEDDSIWRYAPGDCVRYVTDYNYDVTRKCIII
jgi:hypothetical protein